MAVNNAAPPVCNYGNGQNAVDNQFGIVSFIAAGSSNRTSRNALGVEKYYSNDKLS